MQHDVPGQAPRHTQHDVPGQAPRHMQHDVPGQAPRHIQHDVPGQAPRHIQHDVPGQAPRHTQQAWEGTKEPVCVYIVVYVYMRVCVCAKTRHPPGRAGRPYSDRATGTQLSCAQVWRLPLEKGSLAFCTEG